MKPFIIHTCYHASIVGLIIQCYFSLPCPVCAPPWVPWCFICEIILSTRVKWRPTVSHESKWTWLTIKCFFRCVETFPPLYKPRLLSALFPISSALAHVVICSSSSSIRQCVAPHLWSSCFSTVCIFPIRVQPIVHFFSVLKPGPRYSHS